MDEVFLENSLNIKEEFVHDDNYQDDKVCVGETIINTNTPELNEYEKDDQIKLDVTCTDIKLELSSPKVTVKDKIKIEYGFEDVKVGSINKQLFCINCNEYYEEYCTKCEMLICLLNRNSLGNTVRKEIPKNILEIKEGLFGDTGIFALKTIPKGVKFGPFTGLSISEFPWKLKGGKLLVDSDKTGFLNWMQYINSASSDSKQNLCAFQYDDKLYYRSIREIQIDEELLVYFGDEYKESLNKSIEMDFMPTIKKDVRNVFACTFCCLGFSLKVYLVEHKTICRNGIHGDFEELIQCQFCGIYLEKKEYLEYHKIYCCKTNARDGMVLTPADDTLEESKVTTYNSDISIKQAEKPKYSVHGYRKVNIKNIKEKTFNSHPRGRQFKSLKYKFQTNNKYYIKSRVKTKHPKESDYKCMECEYKTNNKPNLKRHIKTKHLKGTNYKCMECEYGTNYKSSLEAHVKTKHLQESDYKCMECEYKTNYKSSFEVHVKTKHLKECDYKCLDCEFKTSYKSSLEAHGKTKHLKSSDYKCMVCEYQTNYKSNLEAHIKAKHLKERDYKCMECEFKTNYKSSLEAHVKTKHLKEKDYKCMECEFKTNYKASLEAHVKTKHLKESDYKCMECEFKTNYKSSFEAHVKTKHLIKSYYKCIECEFETRNKYYLKLHVKTQHLKENDYKCMDCDFKTNYKSSFEAHTKSKHFKENDCESTKCK